MIPRAVIRQSALPLSGLIQRDGAWPGLGGQIQIPGIDEMSGLGIGQDDASAQSQGLDPGDLKKTIEKLQGLGLIDGRLSAEDLAQFVMLLANQRNNNKPNGQGSSAGGMPSMGGAPPQVRSGLPTQNFQNTAAKSKNAWRPQADRSRAAAPDRNSGAPAVNAITNPLTGNDKQTAAFIDKHLADRGSPAAKAKSPSAGEMMVQAGKQHNVDPMVLLSISQHETNHGKLGVGMRKMLGVSAYDRNPNNVSAKFDGLRNQIFKGAQTFAKLRKKGGATANDSIGKQLQAANRGGWATDRRWHSKVGQHYNNIAKKAQAFNGATPQTPNNDVANVTATPDAIRKIPNYNQLSPKLQKAALDAINMGLRVTSTTGGKHARTSNHYRHNNGDGQGHAIDVAGSPSKMAAFYRKYAGTRPKELFYDPIGGIKRGRQIGPIGGHRNHVHLALS